MPGWKLATPQDQAPRGAWWLTFHDPLLDRLETQVSIGNQTLAADEAGFRNAEALVDEARASLYLTLSVAPGVTRAASGGNRTSTDFSLEGIASWKIDVCGRIRRAIQSAVATAQADAATLAEARLSEQALLATDYLSLRVWDAYESLCWVLVHLHPSGASIQGANHLYHLHKQAAGGWGVPALTVLYTVSDAVIDVHAIKVG